jgi:acetylornithine aminotransferase
MDLLWYPGHDLLLTDIIRAENCTLVDSKGKRYVDLESGVWCTSVGHGHPRILRVIADQSARIAHAGFNYTNQVVPEAATEILSLLGFVGGRCVFLCSGSEAVEFGVRVAQLLTDRPLLMTMTDSYFGAYGSACRRESDEWYSFDWFPCAECPHGEECSERCEQWAAIPFSSIGGFLFEPGSSSGLVRFPPEKLIRNIGTKIRAEGGLLLVNEVTTGVGRTGKWFGYQHYEITPDIVAMGKGIGNGYPVSVTAFGPRPVERLGNREVSYAQSHQNDPLGAAVATEVIRVVQEEGLIERSLEIAEVLSSGLERILSRSDRVTAVRARGLMAAIELRDGEDAAFTADVHHDLAKRGFVVARRPGLNVLRLDPSLTIGRADLEAFMEGLEEILTSGAARRR